MFIFLLTKSKSKNFEFYEARILIIICIALYKLGRLFATNDTRACSPQLLSYKDSLWIVCEMLYVPWSTRRTAAVLWPPSSAASSATVHCAAARACVSCSSKEAPVRRGHPPPLRGYRRDSPCRRHLHRLRPSWSHQRVYLSRRLPDNLVQRC